MVVIEGWQELPANREKHQLLRACPTAAEGPAAHGRTFKGGGMLNFYPNPFKCPPVDFANAYLATGRGGSRL